MTLPKDTVEPHERSQRCGTRIPIIWRVYRQNHPAPGSLRRYCFGPYDWLPGSWIVRLLMQSPGTFQRRIAASSVSPLDAKEIRLTPQMKMS